MFSLTVNLSNFQNLRSLNVSYTEFNQFTLEMICEDLKLLEKLDISGTVLQDLYPLLCFTDQLVSLTVCVSIACFSIQTKFIWHNFETISLVLIVFFSSNLTFLYVFAKFVSKIVFLKAFLIKFAVSRNLT